MYACKHPALSQNNITNKKLATVNTIKKFMKRRPDMAKRKTKREMLYDVLLSKTKNSFEQNPNYNDEAHKEGMGRNTKL
jgi:nitrate/TMAO reductase-like tetraheme cytochrome c subunit